MDQEILDKFAEQDKKLEAILQSVEKTRKYFLWIIVVSAVLFVLPLIGILILIPQFFSTYSQSGLGL